MAMQGLLNNGDEVLIPALVILCGQLRLIFPVVRQFIIYVMKGDWLPDLRI